MEYSVKPKPKAEHMQEAKPQHRSPKIGLSLAIAILIGTGLALGQDQKPATTNAPPPPKNPWDSTAAAGLTLTRGNSRTMLATLSLDTKRKWETNEALFGAQGGYGEDHDVRNADFANAYGQYNRLFTERIYGGLRVSFNYDGIANLSYRVTVSPLAGYYLIKETNTTLALEVGPALVFEKYEHQDGDGYYAFRAGERFEHKLTASTKIWQSLSYVPQVDKWAEKYIITGEAGIDAAINKQWSLRVVLQDIYDSQPATGREHNDMRLIAGTAYKF
jgi:putative salt-induced outer membrane protein YdiY